jgi:hypothetical protein
MNLIDHYQDRGINKHTVWIYEENGVNAGIDHNHDIYGAGYYCFTGSSHGEGCETKYYNTLKEARIIIRMFLSGEISKIPERVD